MRALFDQCMGIYDRFVRSLVFVQVWEFENRNN